MESHVDQTQDMTARSMRSFCLEHFDFDLVQGHFFLETRKHNDLSETKAGLYKSVTDELKEIRTHASTLAPRWDVTTTDFHTMF